MRGKRARSAVLGTLIAAALIAVAMVVLPAIGSSHNAVTYDAQLAQLGFAGPAGGFQPVQNGSGCLLDDPSAAGLPEADQLIALSSDGQGNKGPGLVGSSIGVKTGGSNGTPCSFTEFKGGESLTLTSLKGPWNKLELDVELKDNAWVRVTFDGGPAGAGAELVSGSSIAASFAASPTPGFPYGAASGSADLVVRDGSGVLVSGIPIACANPSDSGPDSGANDNCYWTIEPGFSFGSFTIEMLEGNASLEGGGDDADLAPTKLHYVTYSAVDDVADDAAETDEDNPVTFNVLDNDLPPGVMADVAFTYPTSFGGSFEDGSDPGSFNFDPGTDFQSLPGGGSDSVTFSYEGTVGGVTDSAQVTLVVNGLNDAPVPVNGGNVTAAVDEDSTGNSIQLATDVDNPDPLTASCSGASGTVVSQTDGSILYTPVPDSLAPDSFTCSVSDGDATTDDISVSVTINNTNDSPVASSGSADMDHRVPGPGSPSTPVVNSVEVDVVAGTVDGAADSGAPTATDDDGDSISVKSVASPLEPVILDATPMTLEPTADLGTLSVSGGVITYTPGFDDDDWLEDKFSTVIRVQYRVTDGTTPTKPTDEGPDSELAVLSITVNRVVCSSETVEDTSGDVFGAFTNVTPDSCKQYEVRAFQDVVDPLGDYVDFITSGGDSGDPADDVYFLGELRFTPTALADGKGVVGLSLDLDIDGTEFGADPMPLCAGDYTDPASDPTSVGGDPLGGSAWCWYRASTFAVGGELGNVYYIYGKIDPRFSRF